MATDAPPARACSPRLARPYRGRTALAIVTLVAYTAVALLPPYLAKLAVDDGISTGDLADADRRRRRVPRSPASRRSCSPARRRTSPAGSANAASPTSASGSSRISSASRSATTSATAPARSSAASRTTSRRSTCSSPTASRASSRTRSLLVGTAVVLFLLDWRLALATLVVLPLMAARDRVVPHRARTARTAACASGSGSSRRRSPRTSRACASSSRSRASRRARSTFRGVNERYREANYETVVLNGDLLPGGRHPLVGRDRDRARVRRLARHRGRT